MRISKKQNHPSITLKIKERVNNQLIIHLQAHLLLKEKAKQEVAIIQIII